MLLLYHPFCWFQVSKSHKIDSVHWHFWPLMDGRPCHWQNRNTSDPSLMGCQSDNVSFVLVNSCAIALTPDFLSCTVSQIDNNLKAQAQGIVTVQKHMTNKKGTTIEQWCEFPSTIISSLGQWHDVFVTFFVHSTFKIVKIDTFFTGNQGIDMKWKQGVTQLSNDERFCTIIVSLGQWNDVLATFLANLALVHRLCPVIGPLAQKARPS